MFVVTQLISKLVKQLIWKKELKWYGLTWNFCLHPFLLSLPAFVQLMHLELRQALSFLAVICLKFSFCSSLLQVPLPSRVRDDLYWCQRRWNMYIPWVLCYLALWISHASVHFLDLIYALWFLFSWASEFPFSWCVVDFSILCTHSAVKQKLHVYCDWKSTFWQWS